MHTRMSKIVEPCLDQQPRAWMSSRASGAVLAHLTNDSPVISCTTGLISTSWQTRLSICASRSRSSIWRCIMKPTRLQIIAWSTLKGSPQTHTFGISLVCQSYLRWTESLNSLLLRFKSIYFIGMTVSQLEAPFSAARSTALLVFSGREFLRSANLSSSLTSLSLHVVNCKDLIRASSGGSCAWDTICEPRGAVTWRDIACSNPARSTGFSSPSLPFLTGSTSSSRSRVVHVSPVIDGIRASLIVRSNGSSSFSISDIVFR